MTWTGIVRYHVLFLIELATRRVHIAGIAHDPGDEWMKHVARRLTDPFDGFLREKRYLILDRDPLFTRGLREILEQAGVSIVRLPARSPNLNPHAERWVRSIRGECLSRFVILGERFLELVVAEYVVHYNRERHHQGLHGRLVEPRPEAERGRGPIECRERLGGLLRLYHRRVA